MELEIAKSDKEIVIKAQTLLLYQLGISNGKSVALISKELRKWHKISRKDFVFAGKNNRRKFLGFFGIFRRYGQPREDFVEDGNKQVGTR